MDGIPRVRIHTDGGARGNPGPAGAGVVIVECEDNVTLYEAGFFLGRATNNVAEYKAVLEGLRAADRLQAREVELFSDSELLVKQMNGEYRVKNAGLKPLHAEAQQLAAGFRRCTFTHVRREKNTDADKLVNLAINQKANVEDAVGPPA
jgi:ribonuclease HI